jgi:hypothetical protein
LFHIESLSYSSRAMKRKLDAANVPTPESPQPPQASSGGGVSGSVNGGKKSRSGGAPSFSSYGLDARILQALAKQNFAAPTPVQAKAIPLALEGKDILGRCLAVLFPSRKQTNLLCGEDGVLFPGFD